MTIPQINMEAHRGRHAKDASPERGPSPLPCQLGGVYGFSGGTGRSSCHGCGGQTAFLLGSFGSASFVTALEARTSEVDRNELEETLMGIWVVHMHTHIHTSIVYAGVYIHTYIYMNTNARRLSVSLFVGLLVFRSRWVCVCVCVCVYVRASASLSLSLSLSPSLPVSLSLSLSVSVSL